VCLMLGQLLVEDCLAGGLLPVIRVYPGSNNANTPCILHEGSNRCRQALSAAAGCYNTHVHKHTCLCHQQHVGWTDALLRGRGWPT